jgi:hypothetical protein
MKKLQLLCGASGQWVANGTCSGSQFCDSTPGSNAGTCQDPIPNCAGKPGYTFCDSTLTILETCGPDTVSVTMTQCPQPTPACHPQAPAHCVVCIDYTGQCVGQQPQQCVNEMWQNMGPACQPGYVCGPQNGMLTCPPGEPVCCLY